MIIQIARNDDGRVLPRRVIDYSWRERPDRCPPSEWEDGLWGLDHAVELALSGGWSRDEIENEVRQLLASRWERV